MFHICVKTILNLHLVNHKDSFLQFNIVEILMHTKIQLQESWLVVNPERDETKNENDESRTFLFIRFIFSYNTLLNNLHIYVCQSVINDFY